MLYLVGLFVLFTVIKVAVTKGINNKIIGEMFEKQYGNRDKEKGISELLENCGEIEDDDKK